MPDRFLTVDQVTAEAMSVIPGATSEERLLAKQWAYIALRMIGPSRDNIKTITLYPENLSFGKPEDYQAPIDIAIFDSKNAELLSKYRGGRQRIHQDVNFIEQAIIISDDSHFFYLSSDGADVTYAKLRYFAFPVDIDGQPMFPEYTRFAIMMFIRYMCLLSRDQDKDRSQESRWEKALLAAKGKYRLNALELKAVAKEFNSMIQKVNFDRF